MVKKSAIALIFISLVLLFFFGFYKSDLIYAPPFEAEFPLQNVELAVADLERNIVFYDRVKKTLTKFDQNSFLVWTKKFDELVVPLDIAVERSGDLYLLNNLPLGNGRETYSAQIVKIDKNGESLEILYNQNMATLSKTPMQLRPVFQDLRLQNNELTWFELGSKYIMFHRIDLFSGRHLSEIILTNGDELGSVLSVVKLGEKFFVSLIGGRFCQIEAGQFKKTNKDYAEQVKPWWIGTRGNDLIWNELSDFSLYSSNFEKMAKHLIFDKVRIGQVQALDDRKLYKKISLSEKYLTLVFSDSIAVTDLSNGNYSNIFVYKLTEVQIFQQISQYLFLIEAAFLVVLLFIKIFKLIFKIGLSLLSIATILVAAVQSGLFLVFAFFDQSYVSSFQLSAYKAGLDNASLIMAYSFPGTALSKISYLQYDEKNYEEVVNYVDSQAKNLVQSMTNDSLAIVYKLEDERIRVVYSSNRGMGIVQVSPEFDDPSKVFWKALQGNIVSREVPSAWGQMISSISPIRDSNGKAIGLLEFLKPIYEVEKVQETAKIERSQNMFIGTGILNVLLIALIIVYKLIKSPLTKGPHPYKTSILELKYRDRRISYLSVIGSIFQNSVQEFYDRMAKRHKENNLYYLGLDFESGSQTDSNDLIVSEYVYQLAPHVTKNKVIFALLKSRDLVVSIMQEFDSFKLAVYNLNIASYEILRKKSFSRLRFRSIAFYHFSPKISREVFFSSLIVSNNLCDVLKRSKYYGTFLVANADSEISLNMSLLILCKCKFKNSNGRYVVYEIIDGLQFEMRQAKSAARDSVDTISKLVDAHDFISALDFVTTKAVIPTEMKTYYVSLLSFYLKIETSAPENEFIEDFLRYLEDEQASEGHR